jgi:hypothetical protein
MTQLGKSADSTTANGKTGAIARRYHSDPPQLWIGLVGSSIVLHLVALGVILPLSARLASQSSQQLSSVPIELVDLNANSVEAIAAPVEAESNSTEEQAIANEVPDQSQPNPIQAEPQSTAPTPSDNLAPPTLSTPNPEAVSPVAETPTPEPTASLPEEPPVASPSASTGTDDSTEDLPLPPIPNSPSPAYGSPTDNAGAINPGDSNLGSVSVNSSPAPAQYTASIMGIEEVPTEVVGDRPEISAFPLGESFQTFISDPTDPNSCVFAPESYRDFGQEVALRVVVEADGLVSQTFPQGDTSRLSEEYLRLADCVIKRWTFSPAYNGDQPVVSDRLIIRLVIDSN